MWQFDKLVWLIFISFCFGLHVLWAYSKTNYCQSFLLSFNDLVPFINHVLYRTPRD